MQSFSRTAGAESEPRLEWDPFGDLFGDYSFTVEMFIKSSTSKTWSHILRRYPDSANTVQLNIGTGATAGKLNCGLDGSASRCTDPNVITDGKWHHIALVSDKTGKKQFLYRDWSQLSEQNITGTAASATQKPITLFGMHEGGGTATFIGKLDEVRITKRALAVKEFLSPDHAKGLMLIVR